MESNIQILVARTRTGAIEVAKAQIRTAHGVTKLHNCFVIGAQTACHCGNSYGVTVTVTAGKSKDAQKASCTVAVCGVCG